MLVIFLGLVLPEKSESILLGKTGKFIVLSHKSKNSYQSCGKYSGGVTCISYDMGCRYYFVYFWGAPGLLGTFWGYSWIFGYHFFVKFDLLRNNPDFWVLILILNQ